MGEMIWRIESIRKAEKKYHDECYESHTLFEAGSWLHKLVKMPDRFNSFVENKCNYICSRKARSR
jgi:hypothetical protein